MILLSYRSARINLFFSDSTSDCLVSSISPFSASISFIISCFCSSSIFTLSASFCSSAFLLSFLKVFSMRWLRPLLTIVFNCFYIDLPEMARDFSKIDANLSATQIDKDFFCITLSCLYTMQSSMYFKKRSEFKELPVSSQIEQLTDISDPSSVWVPLSPIIRKVCFTISILNKEAQEILCAQAFYMSNVDHLDIWVIQDLLAIMWDDEPNTFLQACAH